MFTLLIVRAPKLFQAVHIPKIPDPTVMANEDSEFFAEVSLPINDPSYIQRSDIDS